MKKMIRRILNKAGYDITSLSRSDTSLSRSDAGTMRGAIIRLSELGIRPGTVVDVGAAAGHWTRLAQTAWPDACYDLVEPLLERKNDLAAVKALYPDKIRIHQGVAGEVEGEVDFVISDDLDGSGVYGTQNGSTRKIKVLTIDQLCRDRKGPFMIKLDTHGYEVPILEGARSVLRNTSALIIEVYGFYISPTTLLFHQLSEYLFQKGFRLFDLVDVMRRNKDNAFWQADAIFVSANHPSFSDNSFR